MEATYEKREETNIEGSGCESSLTYWCQQRRASCCDDCQGFVFVMLMPCDLGSLFWGKCEAYKRASSCKVKKKLLLHLQVYRTSRLLYLISTIVCLLRIGSNLVARINLKFKSRKASDTSRRLYSMICSKKLWNQLKGFKERRRLLFGSKTC